MRSRSRTLGAVAGIAVLALGAGIFAGTRITSPADAAAQLAPPESSAVTVPVELRALVNEVVTRGDVSFAGAVEIVPEIGGLQTPAVVTGQVPAAGAEVAEGGLLLEIVGRPVIALAGQLPMYRTMSPGMSGPDVEQLEVTLQRLGYDPGTVDDEYTAATGAAVAELYEKVGYEPPEPDPAVADALDAAEQGVTAAEQGVAAAEQALEAASAGAGEPARVAAQNEVDLAERALRKAKESKNGDAIAQATAALKLAEANLKDVLREPDTSAEKAAIDAARDALAEAEEERDVAAATAGTPLPASEVVFVPTLPRRVDEVSVARGDVLAGAAMSVSGADLVVTAQVDDAARELLAEDLAAVVELSTGEEVGGVITGIAPVEGEEATGHNVVVALSELTAEQVEVLKTANVRVTIPVESTDGEVLAVPVAALTAGPGGESRVEVERDGETALVEVEVGLSAEGYAEVTPVDAELAAGDLVVVGE